MTRRERLMATLRGEPVDRPAVNLYEVGGFDVDPTDPGEFNVYNSPDWKPLLQLAEEQTDLISHAQCAVDFEKVVAKSLREGTAGPGRGFVLMPSACPCGRKITAKTMANYETMVRLATGFSG